MLPPKPTVPESRPAANAAIMRMTASSIVSSFPRIGPFHVKFRQNPVKSLHWLQNERIIIGDRLTADISVSLDRAEQYNKKSKNSLLFYTFVNLKTRI